MNKTAVRYLRPITHFSDSSAIWGLYWEYGNCWRCDPEVTHTGVQHSLRCWGFVSNRKLIITLGKKQKRKNESSDELSDAKQTPQRPLKDEDSQVSSQYSSFRNLCVLFLQIFFLLSPESYTSLDTVTVTLTRLCIS